MGCFMAYTAAKLIDLITHAVGGVDTRHDLWETLNAAGRALITEHQWTWRKNASTVIQITSDSTPLPLDFVSVNSVRWTNNLLGDIRIVTPDVVDEYRQRVPNGASPTVIYLAFGVWRLGDASGPPTPQVLCFPIPTANAPYSLRVVYNRTWMPLSKDRPGEYPNIPEEAQQALILRARYEAALIEDQNVAPELSAYQAEVQRLWAEDMTRVPIATQMGLVRDRYLDDQRARQYFDSFTTRNGT